MIHSSCKQFQPISNTKNSVFERSFNNWILNMWPTDSKDFIGAVKFWTSIANIIKFSILLQLITEKCCILLIIVSIIRSDRPNRIRRTSMINFHQFILSSFQKQHTLLYLSGISLTWSLFRLYCTHTSLLSVQIVHWRKTILLGFRKYGKDFIHNLPYQKLFISRFLGVNTLNHICNKITQHLNIVLPFNFSSFFIITCTIVGIRVSFKGIWSSSLTNFNNFINIRISLEIKVSLICSMFLTHNWTRLECEALSSSVDIRFQYGHYYSELLFRILEAWRSGLLRPTVIAIPTYFQ